MGKRFRQAECKSQIEIWWKDCEWTLEELEGVLLYRLGKGSNDGGKSDYGAVIALLCKEYGSTPDYWMHEASLGMVETLLNDFQRRQDAEIAQMKKDSKGKATGLGITAKGMAYHKYQMKENFIEALWLTK